MSKTFAGHNTWVKFGSQGSVNSAASEWYNYELDGDDSLTLGEEPYDRNVTWGGRGRRAATHRRGMQMPGGGLTAYPWSQDANSKPVLIMLKNFFQDVSMGTLGSNVDGITHLASLTPVGTQQDSGDLYYTTWQKDTGITAYGEQYLDSLIDELEIAWDSSGAGILQLTPTIKARSGSNNVTVSGTGDPVSDAYVEAPNINVTWQGQTIYPQSVTWSLQNNLPDIKGPGQRGRQAFHMGNFTGQLSVNLWRSEDFGSYFRDTFDDDTTGTLVFNWSCDTGYGTHAMGSAYQGTITTYARLKHPDMAAGMGDRVDTVEMEIVSDQDFSIAVSTDLTTW